MKKNIFYTVKRKQKAFIVNVFWIIFFFLLNYSAVFAGNEVVSGRISGSQLAISGVSIGQADAQYPNVTLGGTAIVARSLTKITFGIDESNLVYSNSIYSAAAQYQAITVGLSITSYDAIGTPQVLPGNVELSLSYNQGSSYVDKGMYMINGSHKATATIAYFKDASGNTISAANITAFLPLNLFLEVEVQTERYYPLDYNFSTYGGLSSGAYPSCPGYGITNSYKPATNELEVSWQNIPGAEYYELEWTYINDYTGQYSSNLPTYIAASPSNLFFSFFNNATRVQINDALKYRISLICEHGYILYRVRGVGRNLQDITQLEYGRWSADPDPLINKSISVATFMTNYNTFPAQQHSFNNNDYEYNKNWQFSATFAEEGKKKEVVSYFDGSLRNRQSVTRNNSNNIAIIGETFYDFQGRPSVQALPVPDYTLSPTIKYYENFNLSAQSPTQSFSRIDFDQDASSGTPCPPSSYGMYSALSSSSSIINGAAVYYSPNNLNRDEMQAYLPDSKNYPFSHTVYTPDNTGRIRLQSGVGPDFQINSGHETKYAYSQPDQVQIDRLFGSEAGFKNRYKRNLVIDANGQTSITYINSEGKTIATALAGNAPSYNNGNAVTALVTPLATPTSDPNKSTSLNSPAAILTETYFSPSMPDYAQLNVLENNALVFTKPITPATSAIYTFNYSLEVPQMSYSCMPQGICYTCVYDLSISIIDECGQLVQPTGWANKVATYTVGASSTNPVTVSGTTACNTTPTSIVFSSPNLSPFMVSLTQGQSYTLQKTLTIDQNALNQYVALYLTQSASCLPSLSSFTNTAYSADVDASGCGMTCAQCSTNLVNYNATHPTALTPAQYSQMMAECMAPCTPVSLCHTQYQMMLADVTPNGQYAQYDVITSPTTVNDASNYPLSVLNTANSNKLPGFSSGTINWRNPKFYNLALHGFVDNSGGTSTNHYYEADGITISKIALTVSGTSTLLSFPQVLNPTLYDVSINPTGSIYKDPITGNYFTYPELLNNLEDFVNVFGSNWASSLVSYHPEWKYFTWCDPNENTNNYTGSTYTNPSNQIVILTSERYDSAVRSISTMAAAQTNSTLWGGFTSGSSSTSPASIELYQNDPYFFNSGSELNTAPYGNAFKSQIVAEMEGLITNYQGSHMTIKQIASSMVRCGGQYYNCGCVVTNFGDNIPANLGLATPPTAPQMTQILNEEWTVYQNLYLACKAQVQQDFYDLIGQNIYHSPSVTPNIGFFNAAIGNSSFNPWQYPFYAPVLFSFSPGFGLLDINQSSSIFTAGLYSTKKPRFQNTNTVTNSITGGPTTPQGIQSSALNNTSNQAAQILAQTGQCPISIELQVFLNKMAADDVLVTPSTAPINLFYYGQFTEDLYNQVGAASSSPPTLSCSGTQSNYRDYWWDSSPTGSTLSINFLNGSPTGLIDNTWTLTDPTNTINNSTGHPWTNVVGFGNINYIGQVGLNQYAFNIDAYVNPGNPGNSLASPPISPSVFDPSQQDIVVTLHGVSSVQSTCPGTSAVVSCPPTQTGTELFQIINALNSEMNTNTNQPSLCSPLLAPTFNVLDASHATSGFITNHFGSLFNVNVTGSNPTSILYTASTSGTTITGTFNANGITLTLSMVAPSSGSLCNVVYFSNMQPQQTPANSFLITANFADGSTQVYTVTVTLSGSTSSSTPLQISNCAAPVPGVCNNPGYNTTVQMQNLLNELAIHTLPSPSSSSPATYDLSTFSNYTSLLQSYVVGNNTATLNAVLSPVSTTASPTLSLQFGSTPGCTFTITPTNGLLPAFDFSQISSFTNITAIDETPNIFNISALIGSTTVQLICTSTCMQFQNCEICPAQRSVFNENFEEYNQNSAQTLGFTSINPFFSQAVVNACLGITDFNPFVSAQLGCVQIPANSCFVYTQANPSSCGPLPCGSAVIDHTPIGAGNFLVIDQIGNSGTCSFGTVYQSSSALTVQPGKTYEFSAWFQEFTAEKCPTNVQFTITDNNTNISYTYNTSFTTLKQWIQLSYVWNSINSTSVTISIQAKTDPTCKCEMTLGIDDIGFSTQGCPPVGPPPPPPVVANSCADQASNIAAEDGLIAYNSMIHNTTNDFINSYLNQCSKSLETMTASYPDDEYHFTLYYYDQAGNLVKTIPPEGVHVLPINSTMPGSSSTYEQAISNDRYSNTHTVFTSHTMPTRYQYNSLNQLVNQDLPDHDEMNIWSLKPNNIPSNINVQGMQFSSASNGFIAGTVAGNNNPANNGQISETLDGGITWGAVSNVGQNDLEDVIFIPGTSNGFAITDDGYLMQTINGGTIWNDVNLPITTLPVITPFTSINYNASNGYIYITGNNATLIYSSDNGVHWLPVSGLAASTINFNKIKFSPDNTIGIIVGTGGTVLYNNTGNFTTNSSWTSIASGGSYTPLAPALNVKDVYVPNLSSSGTDLVINAIIVGEDNTSSNHTGFIISEVINTTTPSNSNNPVTSVTPPSNSALQTIVFYPAGSSTPTSLFTAGNNGTMYSSPIPPQPNTWGLVSLSSVTTATISELSVDPYSTPPYIYGALSDNNMLMYNGTIWQEAVIPGNMSSLNGVCVTAANMGVLVGDAGAIINFNGTTPTFNLTSQFVLPQMNNIALSTPSVYALGNQGTIVYSNSNGIGINAWQYVPSTITGNINAGAFKSPLSGVLVGNNVAAYVAGTTIPIVTSVAFPANVTTLNDVAFVPSSTNSYYACGVGSSGGTIVSITSGGVNPTNWSPLPSTAFSSAPSQLNDIDFLNATTAFVVGNAGYFAKSINGGSSWTYYSTGLLSNINLHEVYFADQQTGYAFGDNNTIIKSIDGGLTWIVQPGAPNGSSSVTNYQAAVFTGTGQAIIAGTPQTPGSNNAVTLNDQSNNRTSRFFYDELGRLIISQNSKQYNQIPQAYSYTIYDALGRISQVGQITNNTDPQTLIPAPGLSGIVPNSSYQIWVAAGTKSQVTSTIYDYAAGTAPSSFSQLNLRKRVSATYVDDLDGNLTNGYNHATYYSYDVHGNVVSLLNDNPALVVDISKQYTRIDYEYDLISGKVNSVAYQQGQPDAFYHKYEYDADNRITNVYSSRDGINFDEDAKYFYYLHGPLARVEVGDQKVQGIDYAYTLQGWIKGVNSTLLTPNNDIGKDASVASSTSGLQYSSLGNLDQYVAEDAYSYSLNYFNNPTGNSDYTAIETVNKYNAANRFDANPYANTDVSKPYNQLYNGNITAMATTITDINPTSSTYLNALPQLSTYKYDQLNRIKNMSAYSGSGTGINNNVWASTGGVTGMYANSFTYDANGNILNQTRSDQNAQPFDVLSYQYEYDANGYLAKNRLYHVNDGASQNSPNNANLYTDDIKDENQYTTCHCFTTAQPGNEAAINTLNNYGYDEIGELIRDNGQEIANINWNVYGKITQITRTGGSSKSDLAFEYDAAGNRISKTELRKSLRAGNKTTYYLRDAQGNVMATYVAENGPVDVPVLKNQEYDTYGSKRLGLLQEDSIIATLSARPLPTAYLSNGAITPLMGYTTPTYTYSLNHTRGQRQYELDNHLGNVLTVVSDNKIPVLNTGNTSIVTYTPNIISSSDYYPFGSPMYNRNYSSDRYRYGFNGKEKDDEVEGAGNEYDFGERIYDPRLGRWLSIDKKFMSYPQHTPYDAFNNNPIFFIDLKGLDGVGSWESDGKGGQVLVIKADYHYIEGEFDTKVLEAVKGDFNDVKTDGHGTNIKLVVNFIPEKPGTDLSVFTGENGQNYLKTGAIPRKDEPENANYQGVTIDMEQITGPIAKDNKSYIKSPGDVVVLLKNAIGHGIGHNIGMIHADEGVMDNFGTHLHDNVDVPNGFGGYIQQNQAEIIPNPVTEKNAYKLENRTVEMTEKGREYWKDKPAKNGRSQNTTGIIQMKNAKQPKK
jgi:RHS repeat-associated protein